MNALMTAILSTAMLASSSFALTGTIGTATDQTAHDGRPQAEARSLGEVLIVESGMIGISADGLGMAAASGLIQVEKPSTGATVRSAYLATASNGYGNSPVTDGCVTLGGVPVIWDLSVNGPINNYNHWSDVTAIVAPIIDPLAAGIHDLTLTECNYTVEGSALYVIFDDPETFVTQTAIIAFGSQSTLGDTFSIGFGAPAVIEPGTVIELGLAISYGAQGQSECQNSYIDINGIRMTSQAGHTDDGEFMNGALVTVGGIGDSRDNPADPLWGDPCVPNVVGTDDELYDVASFVNDGDTQLTVSTVNPSGDDNIFAAHMLLTFAAVVNEGAVLTPGFFVRMVGETHLLTATLQDEDGHPVVGRDVSIDVTSGPNTGAGSGTLTTDANGQATWSYSSALSGTDTAIATFLDSQSNPASSNPAVVIWESVVEADELPQGYRLDANHPNPFNPGTRLSFNMPATGYASLTVFDLQGREVATLLDGMVEAGNHELSFDASNLASGSYIYTLKSDFGQVSRRMTLLR